MNPSRCTENPSRNEVDVLNTHTRLGGVLCQRKIILFMSVLNVCTTQCGYRTVVSHFDDIVRLFSTGFSG